MGQTFQIALGGGKPGRNADRTTKQRSSATDRRECTPPTRKQIIASIDELNNNKSPGRDGIPAEVIKNAGDNLINHLHKLMVDV
jgi:hypothetical protein